MPERTTSRVGGLHRVGNPEFHGAHLAAAKGEVTQEEYDSFYQDKFGDFEKPLATVKVSAEGTVEYQALLFIPGRTPYNFYTREYEKGCSSTPPACSSWRSAPTCCPSISAS